MIRNALVWLMDNLYNYMIPLCLLCVLRVAMCYLELGHMKRLREKKFVFRKVGNHYKEIGTFIGLFIGFVLVCVLPLKIVWFILAIVLGVVGFKIGGKKGAAADAFWREVIEEMKNSEDAEKLANAPELESNIGGFIDAIDMYDDEETPAAPAVEELPAEEVSEKEEA